MKNVFKVLKFFMYTTKKGWDVSSKKNAEVKKIIVEKSQKNKKRTEKIYENRDKEEAS